MIWRKAWIRDDDSDEEGMDEMVDDSEKGVRLDDSEKGVRLDHNHNGVDDTSNDTDKCVDKFDANKVVDDTAIDVAEKEGVNKSDDTTDKEWSNLDALVYSFQMMAPCGPCRYEYLSPLIGYCLRFTTIESIKSKRKRLDEVHQDAAKFFRYGNTCLNQYSTEAKAQIISECLRDLRKSIPTTCKRISYNRKAPLERRWAILRAYTFHFWLEGTANSNVKAIVCNNLAVVPSSPGKMSDLPTEMGKKRKRMDVDKSNIIVQEPDAPEQPSKQSGLPALSPPGQRPPISNSGIKSIITSRKINTDTVAATTNTRMTASTTNDVSVILAAMNDDDYSSVSKEEGRRTNTTQMDFRGIIFYGSGVTSFISSHAG